MTTLEFPACAVLIGEAIDPRNPADGLRKAVAIVGEARVRSIAETLLTYNGAPLNQVLGLLSAAWHTKQPIRPVIDHLREMGANATMRAMAANLFVKTDGGFNIAALDALAPGIRALSGLPTRTEVDEGKRVAST